VSGRRLAAAVRGLAAMITLLVLVIGLPVVLYRFGGSPLPHRLPSLHQVSSALLRRDSGALFLGVVRDVSWIAWALFSLAVITESIAAIGGRRAPRLRLGGLQNAAAHLVTLAALTFSYPATALLAVAPAAPVAMATMPPAQLAGPGPLTGAQPAPPTLAADTGTLAASRDGAGSAPPAGGADARPHGAAAQDAGHGAAPARDALSRSASPPAAPQVISMASYQAVVVRPGECLWTIAQRYLGDGDLFPEIVALNLGHSMGGGQVFTDPAVIWPGWVLQLPATASHGQQSPAHPLAHHSSHPSRDRHFSRPHPAASPAGSAGADASDPASQNLPASRAAAEPPPINITQQETIPPIAVFAAGMLTGGVMASIARMRHRQRQARRPGRRIPMPASAPVMEAEQRLRAVRPPQPVTALRTVLGQLGAGLAGSGQQLPAVAGIHLTGSGMEMLLASPASEPPPPPFTVPGGRQGMAWHLALPDGAPPGGRAAGQGDLLPGLLTAGIADGGGGYLLVDLEHLRVTAVAGPPRLVTRVLATAATELATGELAGWYDLILCGYSELEVTGGRATTCDDLDEALDLLAAKAVTLQRRLSEGGPADVRYRRVAEPDDEDWALSLLVSREAPTAAQLSFLADIAGDPGGIAALVAGGEATAGGPAAPATFRLSADPDRPGGIVAQLFPLQLEVRPQALTEQDYASIVSLFETAAQSGDVARDMPPYDGAGWAAAISQPGWAEPAGDGPGPDPLSDDLLADDLLAGDLLAGDPPSGLFGDLEPGPGDDPLAGSLPGLATGPDDGLLTGSFPVPEPGLAADTGTGPPGRAAAGPDAPGLRGPSAEPGRGGPAAVPASAGTLRIGILGSFTINGTSGALLPAQSQLILALTLNGPVGLSNPQLCYLLGADPDHPKPSDSLRQLIARTRRQLGPAPDGAEWIVHLGGGQYALHAGARFDWTDFSALAEPGLAARDRGQLREALALVRGQPFTGCYHWWLDLAFVETVRAQIVDVAELLAGLELDAGDPSGSARAARAGLAGDVAAEQLWRALMRAEHMAGNRSGVREAWQHCLGVIADIAPDGEPHPDTAALYHELLHSAAPWQPASPA
jgi:DNA-binding SARP family transcriptional activator